jgi:hypothetical protein
MYIEIGSLYRDTDTKKTPKFSFSSLVHTLVGSGVDTPGGTTNILTTFDVCPRGLEHVLGFPGHNFPYSGFEVLKIVVFDLIDEVLHIPTRSNELELSLEARHFAHLF